MMITRQAEQYFRRIKITAYKISFVIASLLFISCEQINKIALERISLNENWTINSEDNSISLKTEIPTEIHFDLFQKGIIENPFWGDNENRLQWIAEKKWIYEKSFDIDSAALAKENLEILFKGIDTYADVFLNDSIILRADNQFREWRVDVKSILREKDNYLKILLHSPLSIEEQKIKQFGLQPTGDSRVMTRKAQYVYGWDWAPRIVTSGIWKDVNILAWNGPELNDVFIKQQMLSKDEAQLSAQFKINSSSNDKVIISLNDVEQEVALNPGKNIVQLNYSIDNPKLWWTNGLGDHPLYHFVCSIKHPKYGTQSIQKKIGLRTIELVQEKDSLGKSFYFKLNGVPVFVKGANYIPGQMLIMKPDTGKYRELINDVKGANMNMIRIWGGGIYEHDIFYDLCDELGILVWQDFMFANGMYPADSLMLDNIKIEVEQQLKRLRNHASLALWCGNNEIAEGWANWGWKNNYTEKQQIKMSASYNKIFHQLLPGLVKEFSNEISYWPSSPQFGRGNELSQFEGDSHYWGVWHDSEPFGMYEKKVPRFMSEFGFQSYPSLKTLIEYFNNTDLYFDSPILKTHQKHNRGNELIKTYLQRDYPASNDFYKFIYLSQVLQAEGVALGIEAQRKAMPYCMGSLYWQLNDCWPAISWSGIDYGGRWKALQYFVKLYFEPVLISITKEGSLLKISVINDNLNAIKGKLCLTLLGFDGELIATAEKELIIQPNSSDCYWKINTDDFINVKPNESFINIKLFSENNMVSSKNYFFVKPKDMTLINPEIIYSITKENNYFKIILSTNSFAKNVFVDIDQDGKLSDNYFDLIPGEKKEITFCSKTNSDKPLNLKIVSLWSIIEDKFN